MSSSLNSGTLHLNFDALTMPKRLYVAISVLRGRVVQITEAKPWWRAVANANPNWWRPPERNPPEG